MMNAMTDISRLTDWIWGLVSALLLSVVVAHAVAPVKQDHGRGRGSAFSASTAEVSLKSGTRALVAQEVVQLEPRVPPVEALAPVAATVIDPVQAVVRGVQSAVLPFADTTLGPISARAPPAA